ncbi:hypothetical protein [Botrimarina sp.]|uniref:hypothetical protein n=1 Tax=Botrimarina sp. TaxID=2795802 RepID=UPI0032EE03E9
MRLKLFCVAAIGATMSLPVGANGQGPDFTPLPDLSDANVLYRETFPASPSASRGENIVEQGWDVIRSRNDQVGNVVDFDGDGPVVQNSSAIFGNGDTVPKGDIGGGINNNPQTPPDTTDGILFASSGFYPFLFFTEEVPGGTMASDVNSVVWRGRNNAGRTDDPLDQSIHAVLQVDGQWYVTETGLVDTSTTSNKFDYFGIDLSGGNWASMDVSNLESAADLVPGGPLDIAEITSDFNLAKPSGTVQAWGLYNAYLTSNTRFDYVEFRSDAVATFRTPEPTSACLVALGGLAGLMRRRAG